MNTPNTSRQKPSEVQAILDAGFDPIFVSVVIVIADNRKSPLIFNKARRLQTYADTPESLAALPGQLNSMVRGAGEDAQQELNNFLARLAQPEPPAAVPPEADPVPVTLPPTAASATVPATEQVVISTDNPGAPK